MKVVVLGGSALIGKKTVEILLKQGHEVVAASAKRGVNARDRLLITLADQT